jgi:hypothetical protein
MTNDDRTASGEEAAITNRRSPLHRAVGTGATYLGPGDMACAAGEAHFGRGDQLRDREWRR